MPEDILPACFKDGHPATWARRDTFGADQESVKDGGKDSGTFG